MSVIEKAEQRMQDEIRQNDLGADNGHLLAYWSAYLDGAKAQFAEDMGTRTRELNNAWQQGYNAAKEIPMSVLNAMERVGWMAGKEYAEAHERGRRNRDEQV